MRGITLMDRIQAELLSYDGLMGIYVDDLKGNKIEIHSEEEFETASTIKAYILGCLFDEAQAGRASLADMLTYGGEHFVDGSGVLRALDFGVTMTVKNVATLMIIVSDNIATNMIIDYLGIDTINAFITREGFTHTKLHNRLDFEKYQVLGTTTPKDYGHLFERIARGTLISEKASEEMLAIFKKQHYNSMLTKRFPQAMIDEDTYDEELIYVASKSGSMNACRNDGGIVSTPYGKYIIVLMNKNFHDPVYYGEHPATEFGSKISRLIFDHYMTLKGKIEL
ncbi:MAG: serine hydrolase [Lachnospiraceae bacterium]|nr:serine hydrolase [Lachnospiraceae bacterium]